MKKRVLPIMAAAVLPLLLSNCALIFQGTSDEVAFSSNQSGASVQVDEQTVSLPATLDISKKTTSATFTHPKHGSHTLNWKRDYQWSFFWLDFLFTPGYGLVGWITDGSTGAWYAQPRVISYDFVTGQTNVPLDQTKVETTSESSHKPNKRP